MSEGTKVVVANLNTSVVPAFLSEGAYTGNDDFASEKAKGPRVPRLDISGRVFRVVEGGTSTPLTRIDPDTGDAVPRSSLEVIILASNKGKFKQFYEGKYSPENTTAPMCHSYDGITPSPNVRMKQYDTCAPCPKNAWGSATTENGKESRACTDNKLLAVVPVGDMSKAYQLKVSPSALNRSKAAKAEDPVNTVSLTEYVTMLDQRKIPIYGVVTRLFFDMGVSYPLLRFKFNRFVTAEEFAEIEKLRALPSTIECVSEKIIGTNEQAPLLIPPAGQLADAPGFIVASAAVTADDTAVDATDDAVAKAYANRAAALANALNK